MLSQAEQERISAAIAAAEANTSGEIFCIYERRIEDSGDATRLLWSAALALLAPPLLVLAQIALVDPWSAGVAAGRAQELEFLGLYTLVQAGVFGATYAALSLRGLRRLATPRAAKRARAHRAALQAFLARGLHLTRDRTGVLIFVVEEDHQIEVVADEGIHSKVDPGVWGEAVAALANGLRRRDAAGGFEAAIAQCGAVLAQHFPPRPDDANELPNRIIVVD